MTGLLSRIGLMTSRVAIARVSFFRNFATGAQREFVETEKIGEKKNVGLVKLNRPKSLNALSDGLMNDITSALEDFDKDDEVGAMIITGNGRAFAAGADIKAMKELEFYQVFKGSFLANWSRITHCKKPIIAAVNGYALGGGCELAMMCDIIYASESARFGQPEILLGTIPGAGGTQRLVRSVGKSKAMEICLTGDQFTAVEAERMGLVSRVFAADQLIPEALKLGEKLASLSQFAVAVCKEAVNKSYEMTLTEGLNYERRLFYATFATHDRKEGMDAFVEKRKPNFQHK